MPSLLTSRKAIDRPIEREWQNTTLDLSSERGIWHKPASIPDKSDLLEGLAIETLDTLGDIAATGALVE
jgi:hypothetical protein